MKNTVYTVITVLLLLATAQFAVGDVTIHNLEDTSVHVSVHISAKVDIFGWIQGWYEIQPGQAVTVSDRLLRVERNGAEILPDDSENRHSASHWYHPHKIHHIRWRLHTRVIARDALGIPIRFIGEKRLGDLTSGEMRDPHPQEGELREGRYWQYTNNSTLYVTGGTLTHEKPAAVPVTVASLNPPKVDNPPAVPVQQPVWEFLGRLDPHRDDRGAGWINTIGFYGNSQVIFGRAFRLYNWNISTGNYRWASYKTRNRAVANVEVSESHDIVAHTYGEDLYLRRASDLSLIEAVDLPGSTYEPDDAASTLSMEPRTNYIIISGTIHNDKIQYTRFYDLWENDSWGLTLRTNSNFDRLRFDQTDILNRKVGYGTRGGPYVHAIPLPNGAYSGRSLLTARKRDRDHTADIADVDIYHVAASHAPRGITRIAGLTNQSRLFIWNQHGSQQHSQQFRSYVSYPTSFQFTPNGEILTWLNHTDRDNEIVFWDVTSEKIDAVVKVEQGKIFTRHAFSPDGKTMAVGVNDGSIHIYKWTGGSALSAPAKETERSQPTALLSNYPNPFNPETWIPYQLSDPAEVTVSIYSVDGKLVRTLELGQMPAGVYSDKGRAAYWNGQNEQGEPVASGVYFYTLKAGEFSATRKMVIRK